MKWGYGFLILAVLGLSACQPYAYKQGPDNFTILAKAHTSNASVESAKFEAQQLCETHGAVPEISAIRTATGGTNRIQVLGGYFYVIQDTKPTDYFTMLTMECVRPVPSAGVPKK